MRVEFYLRTDHRWAWHVRAANGGILATDGGQGYENLADAEHAVALVLKPGLEVFRAGPEGSWVRMGLVDEIGS